MSEIPTGKARDATGPIVVGVDGSPSSEEALRWAVHQGRLTGAPVDAVLSWEWPLAYGVVPGNYEEDFRRDAEEALDKSVHNVLTAADAERVTQIVLRGNPARVLLDTAKGAALLVVGCRGHGGFGGLLLGSVSQHVVAHASCAVVVIHGHEGHGGEQA